VDVGRNPIFRSGDVCCKGLKTAKHGRRDLVGDRYRQTEGRGYSALNVSHNIKIR